MPAFELKTWFASGDATWTERFYWVGSSYGAAMQRLQVCTRYRIALLGAGAACTQLRVSDLAVWRDSIVSAPAGQQAGGAACLPSSGLLVRLQGVHGRPSQGFYRTLLLRCFPVSWLPPSPGDPAPTVPAALAALAEWQQALRANGLCIQATDFSLPRYPVQGVQWFGVVNADAIGTPLDPADTDPLANYLAIVLPPGVRIPSTDPVTGASSKVGIHGVRWSGAGSARAPDVNGTRTVVESNPGELIVNGQTPLGGQYVSGGMVQLSTHVYVPIRDVLPRGVAERKVGHQAAPDLPQLPPAPTAAEIPAPRTPFVRTLNPGTFVGGKPPPPPPQYLPPIPPSTARPPYQQYIRCQFAQDLALVAWQGYYPSPPAQNYPIGIYEIANSPGVWLVICSGTDLRVNADTGVSADITSGIGLTTVFYSAIINAVQEVVPLGISLIMSGHSLGSMCAEQAGSFLSTIGYPFYKLIGFGAGRTAPKVKGTIYQRFATPGDKTPYAPLLGLTDQLAGLNALTIVDNSPYGNGLVESHIHYYQIASLLTYNAWGNDIEGTVNDFMYLNLKGRFTVLPE